MAIHLLTRLILILDVAVDGIVGVDVAVVAPLIVRVTAAIDAAVVALKAIVLVEADIDVKVCAKVVVDILAVRLSATIRSLFVARKLIDYLL